MQGSRPSHFLAFQLSQSQAVLDAFQAVQKSIAGYDRGRLCSTLVDPASAHITFGVMWLDAERTANAVDCMSRAAGILRDADLLAPITFPVQGLSTFQDRVLDAHDAASLPGALALAIRSCFCCSTACA